MRVLARACSSFSRPSASLRGFSTTSPAGFLSRAGLIDTMHMWRRIFDQQEEMIPAVVSSSDSGSFGTGIATNDWRRGPVEQWKNFDDSDHQMFPSKPSSSTDNSGPYGGSLKEYTTKIWEPGTDGNYGGSSTGSYGSGEGCYGKPPITVNPFPTMAEEDVKADRAAEDPLPMEDHHTIQMGAGGAAGRPTESEADVKADRAEYEFAPNISSSAKNGYNY